MWRRIGEQIGLCLIMVGFLAGCSTKKDAFLNRNWHALNTRYNVLFNGKIAFEQGRENLRNTYRDNYWEILPVERLAVSGEVKLDSESNTPEFLRAEEKATKAIQRHSMDLDNEERNPETDEAFLLLGKARYFDERYIPALEAFNYILRKYPESNRLNEAAIWREKTNIRLGYEEIALKNLKRLLRFERLTNQEYADARSVMAQAYLNLNIPDTALMQLKTAATYTKYNEEKARFLFISGQLFNGLNKPDSANLAFKKIISFNRSIPRTYLVNAHLQLLQNIPQTPENELYIFEYLTSLKENRENRPFLDKIFRVLGQFHLASGEDSLAIQYLTQSTQVSDRDPVISALNYEDLANYHFDHSSYPVAGAYYDSVLLHLTENTRKFRAIHKKRSNLDDVIRLEQIASHADSTIRLVEMDPIALRIYLQQYTDSLRLADIAEASTTDDELPSETRAGGVSGGRAGSGSFYFYNPKSVAQGKASFLAVWGNRKLDDNWRWGRLSSIRAEVANSGDLSVAGESQTLSAPDDRYNPEYYLSQIPEEGPAIDSLRKTRNLANYQLGLIYNEKFKEPMLAVDKLQKVLDSSPEKGLELPAKYNLFKIYEESGSPLANSIRLDILENYPDTRYAAFISNSEVSEAFLSGGPEAEYQRLFSEFEQEKFVAVIDGTTLAVNNFPGDPLVPKFEMLKANAIGRVRGFAAYQELLNQIALDYPNSEEGIRASKIIQEQLPKMASADFVDLNSKENKGNWKLVFPMLPQDSIQSINLVTVIENSLKDLGYRYRVSSDVFTERENFVVVHGFPSQDYAQGYAELLRNNPNYRIENPSFTIFSAHYKTLQIHKNLQDFNNQNFPQTTENND